MLLKEPTSALAQALDPWASYYNDHTWLQTVVVFLHLGGILLGGGAAIVLDRAAFRAMREGGAEGARHLLELARSHRIVLTGLGVTVVSGLLLFAADVDTFLGSVVYWVKMALFVLLLVNGRLMQGTEKRLAANGSDQGAWRALLRNASVSIVLWFAVLLLGVAVVNAS